MAFEVKRLDPDDPRPEFECGDADLDEFYHNDSIAGGRQLMSVTYALVNEAQKVAAFFSLLNDSIKKEALTGSRWKRLVKQVPPSKRYSTMPAAKIGRLGVCREMQGQGYGRIVLDYLKGWFTEGNKTGCRFLVVDAYNKPSVIRFYENNGFEFLETDDHAEPARIMYYDLIKVRE